MAITNGYCTLADVKAALRLTDSVDDSLIENAIGSASRRIDGYTGRFFYRTASSAITLFPYNEYIIRFPYDIANTTVTIKTDTAGDGTYATTLVQGTDYTLEPTSAPLLGHPFQYARGIGGATFPIYYSPAVESVQVTAQWGWDAVPDDVKQACVLLSMRQFARLNAALGVVGFADMAINVRAVDPDVRDLLSPYLKFGIA